MSENVKFSVEMARGCEVENEVFICLGDFNRDIIKKVDGFDGVHESFGMEKKNLEGRLLFEFCVEKDLCMGNCWFEKNYSEKVIFKEGCSGREMNFLLKKGRQKFLKDVRVIGSELQHKLLNLGVSQQSTVVCMKQFTYHAHHCLVLAVKRLMVKKLTNGLIVNLNNFATVLESSLKPHGKIKRK